MKTLALRIASLLLTAAASVSAGADVLFDNLGSTTGTMSLSESSTFYTDRRFANRIPVNPTPMRIESVQIAVDIFNGLQVEVCDTSPASATPYAGPCTPFAPDATIAGLRSFSGNHVVAAGNLAWVVMRTPTMVYPDYSTIQTQLHSDSSGLAQTTDNGTKWSPSKLITFGMRIQGTQPPVAGACGSAHGVSAIATAPTGTAACAAGTLDTVAQGPSQFAWQCLGLAGGGNAQCSAPRGYTVQTQASGGGSIPAGFLVTGGQTATFHLTIPPNHTASASGCNGALVGSTFTTGVIYSDCTVSAVFTPNTYAIATSATDGMVTCTPNPVPHGGTANCTAMPNPGHQFIGWLGDCQNTGAGTGPCQLTNVTSPQYVSATFQFTTHGISIAPVSGGMVSCTPSPVPHGQTTMCAATPLPDHHFVGWSGDCAGSGSSPTCYFPSVTRPLAISATFAPDTHAIATPTAANGTVTCAPNPVTHGQDASCTATPDTGYHFTGWTGDCSGTGTCQLTNVTAPRSVSAMFVLNTYSIGIAPSPSKGTVTCTPNPVTHGQDASCTATPDTGYHFTGWTGDCSGTGICQLTNVTAPRSVSATFTRDPLDATCGSAANDAAAFKPSANLCATGTAGAVLSASGQYTWQCSGEHGGAAQQCSAPWQGAGGNGNLGAVEVDSANGWEIRSAAFASALPAPLLPHVRAVHAPLGLVLGRAAGHGDAQVTVHFTTPVPQGAMYYKYGPSPDGLGCTGAACAQPHWYALPGAQFAPDGLSVTFTLADGGMGDSDSVPHQITDPGLPVLLAPQAVPALGPWALALLSLLAGGLAAVRRRALSQR
ncbi:IPTL-CTERM sorting domain-containing protein [Acidovorax sp. M2(2025)]|uniref:IPTL-CTERM sorting domain-containing protein n=1 Tax=Acidovorax sp. M2(2025) TaxID=3411355 RepID=UPI003BF58B44